MSAGENLWGEEEESFQDMPESAQTVYDDQGRATVPANTYVPPVMPQRPAPPPPNSPQRQQRVEQSSRAIQELNSRPQSGGEETMEESEEDDSDILNDADIRLEQGRLYKLIMRHDLFEGVDADPKAIHNVQKAIRKFAKEQMEIMLGMRHEILPSDTSSTRFPFNALEVEFLKMIAHTGTKGATEDAEEYVQETEPVRPQPRRGLNPIASGAKKQSKPAQKPLQGKAQAPVQRRSQNSFDATIDQIAREEGVPRELLEEGQLLNKPVHELTSDELLKRNQLVSQRRGAQVKSANAVPMPSPEQAASMVENSINMSAPTQRGPLWSNLISKVKTMPKSLNHQDWSDR